MTNREDTTLVPAYPLLVPLRFLQTTAGVATDL